MSRQTENGKITRIPCHARCHSPTLMQVADEWLSESRVRLKQSTLSTYAGVARAHILPALKQTPVNQLDGETVSALLTEAAGGGLSPHTIGNISAVFRGILGYAYRAGYIASIPDWTCPSCRMHPNSDVLTKREKKKLEAYLIKNADNGCSESFGLLLCLYTGMRLGEICALRWNDISSKAGTVSISKTVQRIRLPGGKTALVFDSPKSSSSNRIIPIPRFLRQLVLPLCKDENCFVLTGTAKNIDPRTMQNHFKAVLKKCGVRPINFHAMRHTFATDCVAAGIDPKTLSTILGHSDVSMTLNTYVHPSFEAMRHSMDKLRPSV